MKTKLKTWKRLSTRTLVKNPYLHVEEDRVLLPTGETTKYYISDRKTKAVSIIAINANSKILLQKEYRYPVGKVIYEFPGGRVDKRETFLQAAKRELREETGISATEWKKLGQFYASVSHGGVVFSGYIAKGLQQGVSDPDPAEFVEHEWVSMAKLRQLLKNGTIVGQTTLAMLYLLESH